jgi:glycosidase
MEKSIILRAREISSSSPFHLPPAAQTLGSKVRLILENAISQPEIVFWKRLREKEIWRVQMTKEADLYVAEILLPLEPTIVCYYFEFSDGSILKERCQIERADRPNSPVYKEYEEKEFRITVYDSNLMPAKWTFGMLIYQIFPDRFFRGREEICYPQYDTYGQEIILKDWDESPESPPMGRDFFGGDLRGLLLKLEYLHEIGIDCIYLCPVYDSPTNHRYDTTDYSKISPMLGDEAELVELIKEAHQKGMRIILDAVFNHCSCDSIYFDMPNRYSGAYHNKRSPYYRWFSFNRWPEEYQKWFGHTRYPEFVECPEVEDFFLGSQGIVAYWLERGVDGWRTDATRFNSEHFWSRFRERVNTTRPDAYLVCEEWEDASHYLLGGMFSAATNYRWTWAVQGFFADEILTTSQFEDRLATLRRQTPSEALLSQMNLLSSHDVRRVLSACHNDERKVVQMVAFQMGYPGAPSIYYGDEAGLVGESGESGRKPFPWQSENLSILNFYRKIIRERNKLPAIKYGTIETLVVDDEYRIYVFARRFRNDSVYLAYNASQFLASVSLKLLPNETGTWIDVFGQNLEIKVDERTLSIVLPPRGFTWCIKENSVTFNSTI